MNFWQYLDNLNKRKYLMKLRKYYIEERQGYSEIVNDIPQTREDILAYNSIVKGLREKVKFYEDKLNELL